MKISNTVDTQELLTVLSKGGYLSVGGAPLKEILTRLEQDEKAVARVREALSSHPRTCDRHTENDPVKCGWQRAVIDVQDALDGEQS